MKKSIFTVLAATAAGLLSQPAQAGVFRTITVDGDVSDWAGIAPAYTDATGDASSNSSTGPVDFTNVYVANDDNFLYFRVQLATSADATTFFSSYYLNTDGSNFTGNQAVGGIIGAEVLLQNGAAYQEAGGGFNEGGINNAQVAEVGPGGVNAPFTPGTDGFEFRISRSATFTTGAAYANKPVFTSDTISLLPESDNLDHTAGDYAGPVAYTFAAVPEPATLGLISLAAWPLSRRRRS